MEAFIFCFSLMTSLPISTVNSASLVFCAVQFKADEGSQTETFCLCDCLFDLREVHEL